MNETVAFCAMHRKSATIHGNSNHFNFLRADRAESERGQSSLMTLAYSLAGDTCTFDYDYDSVGNRKWTKRDGGTGDVFGYD